MEKSSGQDNYVSGKMNINSASPRKMYVTDFSFNLPPKLRHLFQIHYKLEKPVDLAPGLTVDASINTMVEDNFISAMKKYVTGNTYDDWTPVETLDFNDKTGYYSMRINSKKRLNTRKVKSLIRTYFSSLEKSLDVKSDVENMSDTGGT